MARVEPPASRHDSVESLRHALDRERALRFDAERSLAAQSRWIAEVSHEMRSTLSAILVWADVIAKDATASPDARQGFETIAHNARRHLRLAEDMVDYASARAGRLRMHMDPVDLRAIVTRAVDSIRPSAASRFVGLHASLFTEAAPFRGDADRLEQVFVNVLWNALNHTPQDGSIVIDCSSSERRHRVTVMDTGSGIEPSLLASVFEPFAGRDAEIHASIVRGAGLGLAVTKAIVDAHGGEIAITSDGEERGTTVTIAFPR
jgi:signal transduction histidine kinase